MSTSETTTGRGARKRREDKARRAHRQAMAWWRSPGVLVFLVAVLLAVVGWAVVFRETMRVPAREARVDGLHLKLVQARWLLDQMDHGENFQKPSTMMPDMPPWGKQRVTLDLAMVNRSERPQVFDGSEFVLVPELGEEVPPMGAQAGRAILAPGQAFNTALFFDFDTRLPHGRLKVEWRRHGEVAYLPIPEPAEHYHLRPRGGEVALPPDAALLMPIAKAERGEQLYRNVYGCVACHGDPSVPGTNNVGPHLGAIAAHAGDRIDGVPAAQYIYDSILDPNAFIAPECKAGRPCPDPSAMPEYASLMDLQDAADLLGYLLEQRGTAEAPPGS